MDNFLELLSPERKASRLEDKLNKAISANNQEKIISIFCKEFMLLLHKEKPHLLSNLVLSYLSKIEDITLLEKKISSAHLRQAASVLEENQLDLAALNICDRFKYDMEAIEILAKNGKVEELILRINKDNFVDKELLQKAMEILEKQGMADDLILRITKDNVIDKELSQKAIEILAKNGKVDELIVRITKGNVIDKELLQMAIVSWEKYNGDIRESPTMGVVLKNIAKVSLESIPDNPRVREIIGQFKEAALLYVKEGKLNTAAHCYEKAELYLEACKIYEDIGNKEGVLRAAESLGDLEKAFEFAIKPEHKMKILIKSEKFYEAREFATGLESPDEYFDLIKKKARKQIEAKVKSCDFIDAMKLVDVAECTPSKIEEILLLGRQDFNRKIASSASDEDIKSIYRNWVKLEEEAGNFEEAGRMAEEVLKDMDLASLLYEKANRFDRAIAVVSKQRRLAELHEKGGNFLKAAEYYEAAGEYDKAFSLYEKSQHFEKAIECYLKTSNPLQNVLIQLYREAGEFEKLIEIFMKSGTFLDLENALSIAKKHRLTNHIKVIQDKRAELLSGTENDLKRCFTKARHNVLSSYSPVFGIDFGTTNSVVAIFNKKSKKVEIILNSQGYQFEPSFFGVDKNNRPIFGETAKMQSLIAPDRVVSHVKRRLGERRTFSVGVNKYRSEEIVAKILNRLRFNAEAHLKSKVEETFYDLLKDSNLIFPEEILKNFLSKQTGYICMEEVVLSVPAYFNDNQKKATRDSAEIAGLRVKRLLHEPTAAALAYGYQKQYSGKLAVIDLGGGTLDISILDVGEGVYDVQTVGGDTKLGGTDIDTEIVLYVLKDIKKRLGADINQNTHPNEIARLRDACENLKINLSSLNEYTIELMHFLNRPSYTFTMKRAELEEVSRPILERIKTTIEKTVKEDGTGIDHFLLVGNATKMPKVRDMAEKTICGKHLAGIDPGTVVAAGAALEGAILSGDLKQGLLLDIIPHSLGIAAVQNHMTGKKTISRLIEKNLTIPIMKSNTYSTAKDNQPNVHIEIYQGESTEPYQNYFLGDFILDGIAPSPAGVPQIEVTFKIDVDCILTVKAVDKGTGNERSIRIDGAVTLSPTEKQNLKRYFSESEEVSLLQKELENIRLEIKDLKVTSNKVIEDTESQIKAFFELFHEKVEVSARLYKVNRDQNNAIQDMFLQKDQFIHGVVKYRDQFTTIINNVQKVELRHLDPTDKDIVPKLQERIDLLSNYKKALNNVIESIKQNVANTVADWIQILESMEPDTKKMTPLETANYHLTAGRANKAREILESVASNGDELTTEAFYLLLKCYIQIGLREEYRDVYKRFGNLFGITYPDFNQLNSFLKAVEDSVFIIQGFSQRGLYSGSGFSIAPNLIATNRHVIEGATAPNIKIIGKYRSYRVDELELDPINDLAILKVSDNLKPFRLGHFNFVEPGEQVIAIGFPSLDSYVHSENIYISKGIINSIRRISDFPERNIFIDAKIGSGMSGGPLINDLGEVVGIVTFIRYGIKGNEKGVFAVENQPVALPVHLLRKYLMKYSIY